jgi:hypothetical protein
MKLTDINTPTGRAATRRLSHQVQKAGVAAGKAPRLDLGVLGISIGQTQSTGITSRVSEALAAGGDFELILMLVKELHYNNPMPTLRRPKLSKERATATAVDLMQRIARGQDYYPIANSLRVLADESRKTASALKKLAALDDARVSAAAWLDDAGEASQKSMAAGFDKMFEHADYLTGVSVILYALWCIYSWLTKSNKLDDYQTSIVKAALKKMGIL